MNRRITLKRTVGMLFVVMTACFAGIANQTAKETDLSGVWKSDDGTTLVITQQGPEIKIKETQKTGVSELTYFTDARGETNPTADGKAELQSVSKWSGGVLTVKYSLPQTRNGRYSVKNERIDKWSLSRDGQKLTHTRTFAHVPDTLDPSGNPGSAPRGPAIQSAPLNWTLKRTFKKVA